MIDGKTAVFGLLGNPIEHTLSPFIHRLLYEETGYNGTYDPFFVPEGQLEFAVKGMQALSLKGLNVTVPYKIEVMKYLDEIDPFATSIGACNTLVKQNGILKGFNTDWLGLQKSCEYEGIELKGRPCVIIGAGGSARAVAMMCYYNGAGSITIMNRTLEKAEQICSNVKDYADRNGQALCELNTLTLDAYAQILPGSVVFQTTSVGMHPNVNSTPLPVDEPSIHSEQFFEQVECLIDIIYNPKETLLLQLAKSKGVKTVNGLGMLFFQAVCAFELWTGITMEPDQLQRGLRKLEQHVYGQEIQR